MAAGESQTVEIRNLKKGYACFYSVMSDCGAPAFSVGNSSSGLYDIEYVEFTSAALMDDAYVEVSGISTSEANRNSPPMTGMPPRYTNFDNGAGSAAIYKQ